MAYENHTVERSPWYATSSQDPWGMTKEQKKRQADLLKEYPDINIGPPLKARGTGYEDREMRDIAEARWGGPGVSPTGGDEASMEDILLEEGGHPGYYEDKGEHTVPQDANLWAKQADIIGEGAEPNPKTAWEQTKEDARKFWDDYGGVIKNIGMWGGGGIAALAIAQGLAKKKQYRTASVGLAEAMKSAGFGATGVMGKTVGPSDATMLGEVAKMGNTGWQMYQNIQDKEKSDKYRGEARGLYKSYMEAQADMMRQQTELMKQYGKNKTAWRTDIHGDKTASNQVSSPSGFHSSGRNYPGHKSGGSGLYG
jgi:hypothetical protein